MAGSAAGWVVVTMRLLALPFDWPLIGLAYLLALAFYTRDRLDEKEQGHDRLTLPQRTAWIERHRPLLQGLVWISFLGGLILLTLRPGAFLPLLAGLGFALSYTIRWLPWRGERLGWKHLPAMKMPFVALLWTLTTVITPAAVYDQLSQKETWLLAAAVCLLIMIQILLNDLRDLPGDRLNRTLSLPVLVGSTTARRIGYGLALLSVSLTFSFAPLIFWLTALYSLLLLWSYRREADTRWRVWIEAQGLFAGLVALLNTSSFDL